MSVYSIVLRFLLEVFNLWGKIAISISISFYFFITFGNVIYNLIRNTTEGTENTECCKGYGDNKINELQKSAFQNDYKTRGLAK